MLPAALLLSVDRALLASGVSRASDASTMVATPPASAAAGRDLLRSVGRRAKAALRARGVNRQQSLAQNVRRVGVRGLFGAARQVAHESAAPLVGSRRASYEVELGAASLSLDGQVEAFPVGTVAALSGLREFIESLPVLSHRRTMLQARRRRTDREILSRFGDHWLSPGGAVHQLEHNALHRVLLQSFGITGLVDALPAVEEPSPPAN